MHIIATVATLAISRLCVAEPNQSSALGEPGIEFSIENIKISFAPSGGHARGLAFVKGNEAYRDVMYSYFELCCWAHSDQVPPWSYEENGTTASHALYVAAIDGIPNQVSWRYEAHPNETDVEILANAVRTAKMEATEILADKYNISMPDRPLVTLAAPNFMWMMTELDFWDGEFDPERGMSYNYTRDDWHHGFAVKMSDAVRLARFRLEPVCDTNDTISPGRLDHTFPIAPAGYVAFWNPDFPVSANPHLASRGTRYEGPPAIVLELTNATLSLWAQREGHVWSPWSTRPQVGAHIQFEDHPSYLYSPDDWVWEEIVFMITSLY